MQAKTLAGALGQYELGAAIEDIGAMLDTLRNTSFLSAGVKKRLPDVHDLNRWVSDFKRFTDSIPRLDGTNLDYVL